MKNNHPMHFTEETAKHLSEFLAVEKDETGKNIPEPTKPIPVVFPAPSVPMHTDDECHVHCESRTDVGCVRKTNQDAVIVDPPLFGVADGMGGHQGGEVASGECRDGLITFLRNREVDAQMLETAVKVVNRRIHIRAGEDASLSGMGTTLTCAWFDQKQIYIAHVGDSRCYLYRDGHLEQITDDHSMVMEMVRAGVLTPEQAAVHPMRNVITRAVGSDRSVQVDILTRERKAGDLWLFCSDGLHGQVEEQEIVEYLHLPIAQAADALLKAAMDAGAPDNVSLVLVLDKGDEA